MFGATLAPDRRGSRPGAGDPDLQERCGLAITVTVGGSAIRVLDDANLICYLPGILLRDARFAGSGTGQIVTGGQLKA